MESRRLTLIRQDSGFWEEHKVENGQARNVRESIPLRPPLITLNSCSTLVDQGDSLKTPFDDDDPDESKYLRVPSHNGGSRTLHTDCEHTTYTGHETHSHDSRGHLHLPHPHNHLHHPHIHLHLPRPLLPIVHLILIFTHLALAMTLPYILVTHLIQPMVIWLVTLIPAVLQAMYLLPGIVMGIVGLFKCKPVHSAWLQSGLHLTISILSVFPPGIALGLLTIAHQVPTCTSRWSYTPSDTPNFATYTPRTACEALPKAMLIALASVLVILLEITLTGTVIGVDYRQRVRESAKTVIGVQDHAGREDNNTLETTDGLVRRRWTSGVGELLWDIEGRLHH